MLGDEVRVVLKAASQDLTDMADKGFPLAAPSGPSQTACIAASHREGVGSPTAVEWRGQQQVDDRRSDALGDAGPVAACLRHAEKSFDRFQKECKIINKGLRAVHVAHRNRDKLAFETSKEAFTLLLAELHTDSAREVWLEAIKGLDRLEAPD